MKAKQWFKTIENKLPSRLQQALAIVAQTGSAGRRMCGPYRQVRQLLRNTERFSAEQFRALQLQELRKIVAFTWSSSAGYREHWSAHGFHPNQLQEWDDIRRIPFVTKEMIRDNREAFSTNWRLARRCRVSTSGSTGIPFAFYSSWRNDDIEWAFIHDMWSRRGHRTAWRRVALRGGMPVRGWRGLPHAELALNGELVLSPFHVNPTTIEEYARALELFQPHVIHAYPSILGRLTEELVRAGRVVSVPSLRCLMLGSEFLYDWQEQMFRSYWQKPIMHWYGMSERAILAGRCEHSDRLHIYPQYGLTEFIRADGELANEGEQGELVGTSFFMQHTPFIRYRTRDFAVRGPQRCPQCQRNYPLIETVEGRASEMIVGHGERQTSATSVISAVHDDLFLGAETFEFVQERPGEVLMNYVARADLPEPQRNKIEQHYRERLGGDFSVRFQRLPAIMISGAGKHLFFRSKLPHPEIPVAAIADLSRLRPDAGFPVPKPSPMFVWHRKLVKQVAAILPSNLQYTPHYWHWRRFLRGNENWSAERIAAWQLAQAQRVIQFAYENTPGYRELYQQAGVTPGDVRSLADVTRLPMTTKELLRDNLEDFSVRGRGRRYITTGGSTGIPFGFYVTGSLLMREKAFMHHTWSRAGWRLGQVNAVLRGFLGSPAQPYEYSAYRRELRLSSYYLTREQWPLYKAALTHYRPRVIQAYPSALNMLCDLLAEDEERSRFSFDLILLGSENLYDWQLAKFAAAFPSARIMAWYGHAEMAAYAPWCEATSQYHLQPFYGYTTVMGSDHQEVGVGEEGELVATCFHNFVTPFINYRTLDRAVRGADRCAGCSREYRLLERISGRRQEVIVTGSGRYISMTAINLHDRTFDSLRQFQFYQDTPGQVVFRFVPKSVLPAAELERIQQTLAAKLGGDTLLRLTPVEEIPRTKSGKLSFLEQKLPIKYGDL